MSFGIDLAQMSAIAHAVIVAMGVILYYRIRAIEKRLNGKKEKE